MPAIMDKNNWHKLKFVQKLEISIQTESLEFGSAIRLARKPANSLGTRLLEMSGFNDLARRSKILSPINGKYYEVNPNLSRGTAYTLNFCLWFALSANKFEFVPLFLSKIVGLGVCVKCRGGGGGQKCSTPIIFEILRHFT